MKTIDFSYGVLTALILAAQPATATENVKVGALRCEVSAGLGLIITSSNTSSH